MTSLKFGTSGLRGLVTDLDGPPAYAWTRGFLFHLERSDQTGSSTVLVGRDLRSSSPAIAERVLAAIGDAGWTPIDCGALPTPALALAAMTRHAAAIMVTGSHIPDDRNGLKFYAPTGEIDKADEGGIRLAHDAFEHHALDEARPRASGPIADLSEDAAAAYVARIVDAFGPDALSGLRIGIYEQSSVARDLLAVLLTALGAETAGLGRSDGFVPLDTEAHRPEDVARLEDWAREYGFDAIVSTDGDADRPLVADGTGAILRGDVLGMLVARHLELRTIVTPVTSSSAIERTGIAATVIRTRVGSPYVIAGMDEARRRGHAGVLGFEANGGVLLGTGVETRRGRLDALPTRDAALPIVCALARIVTERRALADVVRDLEAGIALSDRLGTIDPTRSAAFLAQMRDPARASEILSPLGPIASLDETDGVRVLFQDGGVVHYRASGNAPELRCYVEAGTMDDARRRLAFGLEAARRALA